MGAQQSRKPFKGLSPHEERLLANAETAVESLGVEYQASARSQFLKICKHIEKNRWLDASHIAHSIYGEAGTFQRPAMARAAGLLRDILLVQNPELLVPAVEVLQDGLSFFINCDIETNSEAEQNLLTGLRSVAAKSGLEVLS